MYKPNTVYDPVAAVNYFLYSGNQWVSYDDVVSLQAKVTWANNYGYCLLPKFYGIKSDPT